MASTFRACFLLLCCIPAIGFGAEFSPDQLDFFEKKIRPVLAERCYECHSAKAEKLKANLQLDHREHILTGGDTGPSIVPGKPEDSLLYEVVTYQTPDMQMPPKGKLSDSVIADFKKWIANGAAWPEEPVPTRDGGEMVEEFDLEKRRAEHWCWRPIQNPAPPANLKNVEWPRDEIDRFILAKIESAGLKPAPEADKRTWLRRVTFDLIGLPPTREEIAVFLEDESPTAEETVVDRLLASPHFGEKWARHWMDLVRYAESYGHEFDYPIDYTHEYRDYLIRALNADLPYDEFVTEHVAGDLIPEPRRHPNEEFNESILGTAFWYFHEATHAPTDVRQNEADIMDNQIDVFGKTFLGLTVACARCHDHKFDAISTADYYALTAFIESSARQEYPMDPGRVREKTAAQLLELRKKADAELAKISPDLNPGDHLTAAANLIRAELAKPKSGDPWAGIVFEDFDGGNYEGWKVEGEAFGDKPVTESKRSGQTVTGDFGKGFATSFPDKDEARGNLISKKFTIEKPFINFLIAGGSHRNTAAELWVDGKMVLTKSGENSDDLKPATWSVAAFVGKEAEIRIVDQNRGGWGHIHADKFVFADHPAGDADAPPMPDAGEIAGAAKKANLDTDRLAAWCRVLVSPEKNDKKPGGFFAKWLTKPDVANGIKSLAQRNTEARENFEKSATLFENFEGDSLPEGWSASGHGFRATGAKAGVSFSGKHPISVPGTAASNVLGQNRVGTLRTPTFEITTKQIHVRARAQNLFARVVMDNYHMQKFNGLLFRGTYHPKVETGGEFRWFTFSGNLDKYIGHNAFLEFVDKGGASVEIDEIWFSDDGPPPADLPAVLIAATAGEGTVPQNLNAAWQSSISNLKAGTANETDTQFLNWMVANGLAEISTLDPVFAEAKKINDGLPGERYALAMAEGTPEGSFVHIRGSHRKLGEPVPRRMITALGGEEGDRLALANEITTLKNPLTSRVLVNRLWHHLFGRGIVPTVDDFGPMGQEPSHPELLDFLATDHVKNGWSMKHTIRKIVLSQTYRQTSQPDPDLDSEKIAVTDPENILLHRMPVRRLPSESIRDSILAISGRLDPKLFGPSIPTHRTQFMTGRGGRGSGPLDGAGRRSIYGAIYRNFLSPMMLTFDMPGPFGPKGRRSVSNVPAQALALMNDPFVIDQSKIWAKNSSGESDTKARISVMFETALGKPPTDEELTALEGFLTQQAAENGGRLDENVWADLGHVIFNTKDFVYLN
ncbi:MAG: DUF1549 domain-containing protein [Verrucomicrobiales bacterium]|nr:DUF1549 domain-containing protein [Verrucomicrobiales bacterium]